MSKKFGGAGAPKCPTCGLSVFFNEQVMAFEKPWHARCLKCAQCSKTLEPGNFSDRAGKVYCKHCYGSVAGLKGYGYGATNESHVSGGAAGVNVNANSVVDTKPGIEGGVSGSANYAALAQPSAPAASKVAFCPGCGTKADGGAFCASCGTKL